VGQLELDNHQRQLRIKSINKRREPKVIQVFSLDEITDIAVIEGKDADGDSYFEAEIQIAQAKPITVMRGSKQSVTNTVQNLRDFLALPDQRE
jgi:hypothetical protein